MANLYFDSTARQWREKCGCSGGDRTYQPTPNTQPLLFNVGHNVNLKGEVTGKTYFVRPNMIALDINNQDAQKFVESNKAVLAMPSTFTGKQGYRAIIS